MQIPILNGVYTSEASDFRVAYPHNMMPVPVPQGISSGYLRPAEGIVKNGENGPGVTRAGVNWNDVCYRVMGRQLVRVNQNGTINDIGFVSGGTEYATMDYSFDYLSVSSGGRLLLYDGSTLQQISDPDLGLSLDHIWVDGYFMSTDGEFLVVTELNNPFSVNPTKYGSSEIDPDPIKALLKVRNEPHALNRYTIESFRNIGGTGFPFQRIDGAQIQRGTVGTHACTVFQDAIVFVGGGRGESISVWYGINGQSQRLATREIDLLLQRYTEEELSQILVEERIDKGHRLVLIHLPDITLVYDWAASQVTGTAVWFTLGSKMQKFSAYRARNLVWCYDKWLVGDPFEPQLGFLDDTLSSHWGQKIGWEFSTVCIYNESMGAIFHELELVALPGRVVLGLEPEIWTDYSLDGEFWSQRKYIKAGGRGQRLKRLMWLQQGDMRNWRVQRFGGESDTLMSVARLEARIEPLVA